MLELVETLVGRQVKALLVVSPALELICTHMLGVVDEVVRLIMAHQGQEVAEELVGLVRITKHGVQGLAAPQR